MKQVKLFKGIETELQSLEAEVNDWIKANDIKVVSIAANIAPQTTYANESAKSSLTRQFASSDVLCVVTYEA